MIRGIFMLSLVIPRQEKVRNRAKTFRQHAFWQEKSINQYTKNIVSYMDMNNTKHHPFSRMNLRLPSHYRGGRSRYLWRIHRPDVSRVLILQSSARQTMLYRFPAIRHRQKLQINE